MTEMGTHEISESPVEKSRLDFDPNIRKVDASYSKEAEGAPNPESVLHDPEALSKPMEGLSETREGFHQLENGNTLFDRPGETGEMLNHDQGNAVKRVEGDCGLVSAENVARMAGKDVSEADVVDIARVNGDCDYGIFKNPGDNGGATSEQIKDVLGRLGIDADVKEKPSVDDVAKAVESGRGVIACVRTGEFWEDPAYDGGGHAVTVTSVERGPDGDVVAFRVCDSGTGGKDSCRAVSADLLESSLMETVVTDKPIR